MRFAHTCIESLAVTLPDTILTTAQVEEMLRPLYERLKLPFGRLELMTGIRERRVWPEGTRPSDASAAAGGIVYSQRSVPRHDGAGDGVIRPPEDRPAGMRADFRRIERMSRFP